MEVTLGRITFPNPLLVASGTFGYGREMAPYADLSALGGIIPKTVTPQMRPGNPPPRTVETSGGMLNSIGLDNDGIDYFCREHLPYLTGLGSPIVANIAARSEAEFAAMAGQLQRASEECAKAGGRGVTAIELNISCPNVTGGVDFGTDADRCRDVVAAVTGATELPVIAKLTPNVTDVRPIAAAAQSGGADAVSLVNTFQGMAVDWRRRRPVLGNNIGGLSGPAIKPLALRIVHQVWTACNVPVIGVGGIQGIEDVLEFLVAGATAVQVGTANFYSPSLSVSLVQQLRDALRVEGLKSVTDLVGTLRLNGMPAA